MAEEHHEVEEVSVIEVDVVEEDSVVDEETVEVAEEVDSEVDEETVEVAEEVVAEAAGSNDPMIKCKFLEIFISKISKFTEKFTKYERNRTELLEQLLFLYIHSDNY